MIHPVLDVGIETTLSRLPALSPDAARAARLRARCRDELARQVPPSGQSSNFGRAVLVPFVAIGACGIYVYSLVSTVLRFARTF